MSVVDGITGIVLNKLEGLSVERCKEACFKLLRWVSQTLGKFKRLMTRGRALFSWVAWLISKFLKGEMPEAAEAQQARTRDQRLCTRIRALKSWLALREKEFETRRPCSICKRRHIHVEYHSGCVDDGTGKLNCMGWARMKIATLEDELHSMHMQNERREAERIYRSLKSDDDNVRFTRPLIVQDIAQRFGLTISQVKRMAGAISG
jgi:hypothetical protein